MIKTLFVGCVLSLLLVTHIGATVFTAEPRTETRAAISAHPGERLALVIGNARYPENPLRTPGADADAITRLLENQGFRVSTLHDASAQDIRSELNRMRALRDETDVVVFYFAGHALQDDAHAVLLPVDTRFDAAAHAGIAVHDIISDLSPVRPHQISLILIDACLTQPASAHAAPPSATPTAGGLPAGTLVAFGAAPGGTAYDGAGAHGLFTAQLLQRLPRADLPVQTALERAGVNVMQQTAGLQVPWFKSTLMTAYALNDTTGSDAGDADAWRLAGNAANLDAGGLGTPRGLLPQDGEARIELEFWKSIEDSTDAADYEAYLKAYPQGRFAPLAKSRAERYRKTAAPARPASVIQEMDADYVAVTDANLRQQPSSEAPLAGLLGKGSRVHVTGRLADGSWYRVRTSTGDTAYVYADLLAKPSAQVTPPAPAPEPATRTTAAPVTAPVAAKDLEIIQDCPACPEMVALPAGSYIMGDNSGDRSEKPAHSVTLAQPFAIGKFEVTTGQWKACVAAGGCSFKAETSGTIDATPVRDISWSDAQQYVRWLSQTTQQSYRLPTEAEWEYAARAGTRTRYWWGEQIGTGHANCKNCGDPWEHATPGLVSAFPPNPFGLYGMNGGVWEWVSDCWYKSHDGAPADGRSRDLADCREHVIRGGSWRDDPIYVHSASRFKYDTQVRYLMNGFRVVRNLR